MKSKILVLSSVLALMGSGCASSQNYDTQTATKTISIDKKFNGVHAKQAIEITYTQDNKASKAVISGPKVLVDSVKYSVDKNGVLSFSLPKIDLKKVKGHLEIQLNGGLLDRYGASSAGELSVTTPVKASSNLYIDASSSGEIKMRKNVSAENKIVNVESSSSGEISFYQGLNAGTVNLAGSSSASIDIDTANVTTMNASSSSAADIDVKNLVATTVNVSTSSGADADVETCKTNTINLTASSGAEIEIKSLTANTTNAGTSSGGTIKMAGTTNEANLKASSGGDINCKSLNIKNLSSLQTSSGGSVNK